MKNLLLAFLVFAAARSTLGADFHPHFFFRQPYHCTHYDYRLAFDFFGHAYTSRPVAYYHALPMPPRVPMPRAPWLESPPLQPELPPAR